MIHLGDSTSREYALQALRDFRPRRVEIESNRIQEERVVVVLLLVDVDYQDRDVGRWSYCEKLGDSPSKGQFDRRKVMENLTRTVSSASCSSIT